MRPILPFAVSLLLASSLAVGHAVAQSTATMLVLMPHCVEATRAACTAFEAQDPTHLKTTKLSVGDLVDIDVVLKTSEPQSVQTVKAWLSYDSSVLEARSVELSSAIAAPYPGESSIDGPMRIVKIGGATNGSIVAPETPIARVTFRVLRAQADTEIAFSGYQSSGLGNTAVNGAPSGLRSNEQGMELPCIDKLIGCRGTTTPLLLSEPSKLTVTLASGAETASYGAPIAAAAEPQAAVSDGTLDQMRQRTVATTGNLTSSAATSPSSSFALLQVQNMSVTTRERDLYVGWQALRSSELKGYNVYYGTVSGRYIQRKTLPSTSTSIVLRDLEPGTTYFVALRALSAQDQESAFSQEVSVTIGQPETSTAPLRDDVTDDGEGQVADIPAGKAVPGETGLSDSLMMVLLLSAGIGTALAAHRQYLLSMRPL